MNIIAIHTSHDGSISIVKGSEFIVHAQIDRFSNIIASAIPCSKILNAIKQLDMVFDVVLMSFLNGSAHWLWEDALRSYNLINSRTKIIYYEDKHHHYFHTMCAKMTVGDNENMVVIDGGGSPLDKGFEEETIFKKNKIIKQTQQSIGIDYEKQVKKRLKTRPYRSFRDCGKIMALSVYDKELNIFQKQIEKKIKNFMPKTNVTYTGGVAQNVLANAQFLNYKNFKIDPLCTDQGISLGVLAHYTKMNFKLPHPVYLGFKPKYDLSIFKNYKVKQTTHEEVCKILKDNPVALFQGRSEQGQRGLGNRSLIMDATNPNAKNIINRIKKREWYRPFSPAILEEKAKDYFNCNQPSPYMLYVFKNKIKLKSVMSDDGTSRIQTVSKKDNLHFYNLLKNFHVPFVLNTSLNMAGHTLVEDLEDLKYMMDYGNLKYAYLPDIKTLITQ